MLSILLAAILYGADNTVISLETPTKAPNKPLEELIREEEEEDYPPMSECMEFLHLLSPVNFQSWEFMPLWEKILEVVKSPVLLLLTLTTPVVDLSHPKQYWCRPLNTMHLVTGPIFIALVIAGGDSMIAGKVPTLVVVGLCSLAVGLIVFLTTDNDTPPPYHLAFAYLGFLVSVVWIYCIANEIVVLLQAIGVVFNLSDTIIGLTILAWGNCLLDFLSNIAVARKGFPRMGIAACFGSPFLSILLYISH
ncbi:SLC8B1 [Cordylochernes scorpioides]|uniref:SLC8B1 n=1 Tax=Cordylochernes scorpioides TaxID=51811 RepID=A0ABY6KU16_9ARAC|nr:SLC8B1 [Cordylochernes scorpioides]